MKQQDIIAKLTAVIPDAKVSLRDLTGTEDHWEITVESEEFRGLSRMSQHRKVYDALRQEVGGPIHALSITTRIPGQ